MVGNVALEAASSLGPDAFLLLGTADIDTPDPRTRIARDAYDLTTLGWPNQPAGDHDPVAWTYDTSQPGYANTGHTFGDRLSPADRAAVIEYLKTL